MTAEERLAAEQSDDVRGEFVGDLAGAGFIDGSQIAFADELRIRHILAEIEEPALQNQHAVLRSGVTEREVVGLGRWTGPILHPTSASGGRNHGRGRLVAATAGGRWLGLG